MANHRKIALKKSAPDEIEVSIGMGFHRKFKRDKEPFSLELAVADALLEEYPEYFVVVKEDTKTDSKADSKTEAKVDAEKPEQIPAENIPSNVEFVGGLDTNKPIPVLK